MRKLAAILGLLAICCTAGIAAASNHHHARHLSRAGVDPAFTFSTDAASPTWQCSVDGAAWVSCSSPKNYTLAAGKHNVRLRATFTVAAPPPPPPPPPPTPVAPTNTAAPSISGTPQSGSTLTASPGTWTGDTPMTFSYAWSDGATGKTDTLTDADVSQNVSVTVTASNDALTTASATSSSVGPVTAAPAPPSPPPSGSVPCDLTRAAASCWAQHTGVLGATGFTAAQIEANPAAAGFTHVTGNVNVTAANTTLDHEWISGCVAIQASATNFHMTDSLVTSFSQDCQNTSSNSQGGVLVNGNDQNVPTGTVISDTEIDGLSVNLEQNPILNDFGVILGAGSKCVRCDIHGYAKDLTVNGTASQPTLIQDSYIHAPPAPANDATDCTSAGGDKFDPHADPFWADSSEYVTAEHDYVSGAGGGDCVTAAVTFLSDYGAPTHDTVDSTFMEGGIAPGGGRPDAYFGKSGTCATNTSVTNNAFSNDSGGGVQEWKSSNTGNVWSGNVTPETGQTFPAPSNC